MYWVSMYFFSSSNHQNYWEKESTVDQLCFSLLLFLQGFSDCETLLLGHRQHVLITTTTKVDQDVLAFASLLGEL